MLVSSAEAEAADIDGDRCAAAAEGPAISGSRSCRADELDLLLRTHGTAQLPGREVAGKLAEVARSAADTAGDRVAGDREAMLRPFRCPRAAEHSAAEARAVLLRVEELPADLDR